MAIVWTDLPLTAQQRATMLEFEALGVQLIGKTHMNFDVVPANTITQAKRAAEWFRDLAICVKNAQRGAEYTLRYHRRAAAQAYEEANP